MSREFKMKPCPFCGGEAMLEHGKEGCTRFSFVSCMRCFAKSSGFDISTEHSCDEKAVEAWNKRYCDD